MADVAVPERPALVVVPNIPILEVGMNWPLASDGPEDGTFTPEDLAAAVAAQDDPAVRSPILKLGHGPAKAGQPAFGRLQNLRLENDGMTLVADLVGAPAWLADVLPYAWPSRSIEGERNAVTSTGHRYRLRLDALALLGVQLPAIETLDDVHAIYAASSMAEANVTLTPAVEAARSQEAAVPTPIAAGVTTEDIRRSFYDSLDGPMQWWWIREMELDPLTLIVDDDEGGLWRVPVTVEGDAVSFGAPSPVRVEYVPVAAAATSASNTRPAGIVFASRAESRQGVALDPIELRRNMGLAEDATDEDVIARAAELLAASQADSAEDQAPDQPPADEAPSTPETLLAPPGIAPPPGFTLVSDAVLDEMRQGIAAGVAASRTLAKQAEDGFIARHRDRIGPTSNPHAKRTEDHLRREWQRNPGEAEAFAASLPSRRPPTVAAGYDASPEAEDGTEVAWTEAELRAFPELRSRTGGS